MILFEAALLSYRAEKGKRGELDSSSFAYFFI